MSEKKKRNIVICTLCGVLLLMTVGYAAFNTLLNINGTASITSNWDIKITDIKQNAKEGDASSVEEFPKYEDLEATFNVNLVSPGDYITYDVTIENKGTIDAELNKIILPQLNNEAILITTTGLAAGDELLADHSATLTVKIEYNPEVTKQPENKTASFEMKLDYVQKNKSEVEPSTVIDMKGIEVPIVTAEDGLYNDPVEPGRYVYKGGNPNNYITFNGEQWRIIAIETDGTIKIMRNNALPEKRAFDSKDARTTGYCSYVQCDEPKCACGVWAETENFDNHFFSRDGVSGTVESDSNIKNYLNNTYYDTINPTFKTYIENHNWYYGPITWASQSLSTIVSEEKQYSSKSYIGLISPSDFLKSNSNQAQCGQSPNAIWNVTFCGNTQWMHHSLDDVAAWTILPEYRPGVGTNDNADGIVVFLSNGSLGMDAAGWERNVVPTLYLKSDIKLSGAGTQDKPYTIENY